MSQERKIRLKGHLPLDLRFAGFRAGQKLTASIELSINRGAWFRKDNEWYVVWPDNYKIITAS